MSQTTVSSSSSCLSGTTVQLEPKTRQRPWLPPCVAQRVQPPFCAAHPGCTLNPAPLLPPATVVTSTPDLQCCPALSSTSADGSLSDVSTQKPMPESMPGSPSSPRCPHQLHATLLRLAGATQARPPQGPSRNCSLGLPFLCLIPTPRVSRTVTT